jgi:integrase
MDTALPPNFRQSFPGAPTADPDTGPVTVIRKGSASVPIYAWHSHGKTRYTIAYYHHGRRVRRMFHSLDTAKVEAKIAADKIARGMQADNDLKPQEREAYLAAIGLLAPFKIPLVSVVEEWVRCREKLGDTPLMPAVEEFIRRSRGVTLGVTVPEIVVEFLASKKADAVSHRYLLQLKQTLNRFKTAFPGPIIEITAEQIDRWLREAKVLPRTRNGYLTQIRVFFGFAKQRGYLSRKEATEPELLKKAKVGDTDSEVFTPDEMEKLLLAAPAHLIPLLAIGGFAGLRAAEIFRLDWCAVDLDRNIIELRAGQAKTASRRIIPVSGNLKAWLSLVPRTGKVIPDLDFFRQATALARKIGVRWPQNALRHSFISYRLAEVEDAAKVALEAGNSPTIIFKHYRELVTADAAKQWFGILPPDNWTPPKTHWNRGERKFAQEATG